jgi:hypothetical protein
MGFVTSRQAPPNSPLVDGEKCYIVRVLPEVLQRAQVDLITRPPFTSVHVLFMKIVSTAIPAMLVIEPNIFGDARGFFVETFSARASFS